MNLTGQILRHYAPGPVRRRALGELLRASAAAFQVSAPPPARASADDLLEQYAIFTAVHAAEALRHPEELPRVRQELYDAAYAIGARLRRDLAISSTDDAMAAARAVYRILGIDFQHAGHGEVRVPRCFFSRFYSASTCRLMSALDQGLLAGLSGGGRLEFRQRITEGAPCCLATFSESSR